MKDNRAIRPISWQGVKGAGRCQVSLTLQDTGQGISGLLVGGERPHVGGVVLALPRPSLSGEGWSQDVFITPVPGHKDVEVAHTVAGILARDLRCPVVVSAGIHSDNLSTEELKEIILHCDALAQDAIECLKSKDIQ